RCCACPWSSPVPARHDQAAKVEWGGSTRSSCAVRGCCGAAADRGGVGGDTYRRRQRPEAGRGATVGELPLELEISERRSGVGMVAAGRTDGRRRRQHVGAVRARHAGRLGGGGSGRSRLERAGIGRHNERNRDGGDDQDQSEDEGANDRLRGLLESAQLVPVEALHVGTFALTTRARGDRNGRGGWWRRPRGGCLWLPL